MALQERDFFDETSATKPARLTCTHCRESLEYGLVWIVRRKKAQPPRQADATDRARFAKAQSYMVRRDDKLTCANPRCRKSFEINGVQSVVMLN